MAKTDPFNTAFAECVRRLLAYRNDYFMHYFLIYKPYNMLSQFTAEQAGQRVLAELHDFPPQVYPIGRLDYDSEGLLLLSDDKALTERLLHPKYAHSREYTVQVEGLVSAEALAALRKGVRISINGKPHQTLPVHAERLPEPPLLPERVPPIRARLHIPTSWLRLRLTEGKNRQVRRMTAAVGAPTLRLIRTAIGRLSLNGMQPGDVIALDKAEVYEAFGW